MSLQQKLTSVDWSILCHDRFQDIAANVHDHLRGHGRRMTQHTEQSE
jgi:hypothetical protein